MVSTRRVAASVAVGVLVLVSVCAAASASDVVVLTDKNFDDLTQVKMDGRAGRRVSCVQGSNLISCLSFVPRHPTPPHTPTTGYIFQWTQLPCRVLCSMVREGGVPVSTIPAYE